MLGIRIFVHALRMVLNNLGPALRISALPMGALFILVILFGQQVSFVDGALMGPGMRHGAPAGAAFGAFVLGILQGIAALWIAVAWHRFILIEEISPGYVPRFEGGAILSYLWAAVLLALVLILAAIPLVLVVGLLTAPFMAGASMPGMALGGLAFLILVGLPLAYVSFRLSPILPSAAIGKRIPMSEAWYATGTSGAAFVVLALVTLLASWIVNLPIDILLAISPFLAFLWAFAAQWAILLVGVSLLTTIYGHFIEKRELDA